ncbi:hypothetical protein ACOSP7_021354 [Xanthoceras sorbifolium]
MTWTWPVFGWRQLRAKHAQERINHKARPITRVKCLPRHQKIKLEVYITIGDGGNREGLALKFKEPASPLSLYRESSFGHGRLKILNETRAHWSWHRNNESNSVMADEVWLESLSTSRECAATVNGPESSPSILNDEL